MQPMTQDEHIRGATRRRQTLRSVELFTGAGGLALGTHGVGFRHQALIEWNKDACATLRANVRQRSIRGISNWKICGDDIRAIEYREYGPIDLVAGGPPCQPFSIGGKHQGLNDQRDMIPEFIRALRELRPRAFLFENVKGLTRQSFRNYFAYVRLQMEHPDAIRKVHESWTQHLQRLEDLHTKGAEPRYNIVARLLNAANYGVPQTRQRVFIVGFRNDLEIDWHFPTSTHSQDALLHDQWISGDYWRRHKLAVPEAPSRLVKRIASIPRIFRPEGKSWRTLRDAIHDLPSPAVDREELTISNHKLQPGARSYVGHTGSPLDAPSKTLKAGVHGVPGGENMITFPDGSVRYLTVREAARVQTFPDSWSFVGSWSETMRQLGNAVPRQLAHAVAASIADRLKGADARQTV